MKAARIIVAAAVNSCSKRCVLPAILVRPMATIQRRSFDVENHENSFKNDKVKDFFVKDDPDAFGTLSHDIIEDDDEYEDEGDVKEEQFLSERPLKSQQLSIKKYADMIMEHVEKKRLKEAFDVLEIRMLQEDKVKPTNYIYNLLIYGCAQVGYTKKAFMLFNDMKRRAFKPTGATYTSLFNCCSNSPWPTTDGLQRARQLRELMAEKQIVPDIANYNAMIKAFGRCGDILTAFNIIDEMRSRKFKIRVHTFNFLLQSCITDKRSGFRHALIVWRKILQARERPNIYSFNLMLKIVKDCDLGDENFDSIIKQIIPPTNDVPLIESPRVSNETKISVARLPNLLTKVPHLGDVMSVNEIKSPQDRFELIGGIDGFLAEFDTFNVLPDIKTITQLLDVTPNTRDMDDKILHAIENNKIKPDIDFYNLLIKRRTSRKDMESAKAVLDLIASRNSAHMKKAVLKPSVLIKPNIMTYGTLALTCLTLKDAQGLILHMKQNRIRINVYIVSALLKCATNEKNFDYVRYVMELIKDEDIPINKVTDITLNLFHKACTSFISEMKNNDEQRSSEELRQFIERFEDYCQYYKKAWRKKVKYDDIDETEHPWTQFRENQKTSVQRPSMPLKKRQTYKRKGSKFIKYRVKY